MSTKAIKLIVVTGPESSGKTSLVTDLSHYYQCMSVDEYARWYLQNLNRNYEFRDLLAICRGQESEMLRIRESNRGKFLFIDTWALVLMIWSEYKYDRSHISFQNLLYRYKIEHFFLCAPDIPWAPDPFRENPHNREELFKWYKKKMKDFDLPYTVVKGKRDQRLNEAISILDTLH